MEHLLALNIGGYGEIQAPSQIPRGGILTGRTIIQNGLIILFVVATLFSLFMLILGGINWITSNGDKAKIESARKRILYAILGLVVTFMSFFIVNMVGYFFGIDVFTSGDPAGACVNAGGTWVNGQCQ